MHKHKYRQNQHSNTKVEGPPVKANDKEEKSEAQARGKGREGYQHRFWEMTRFELIMSSLTALAGVIALGTGVILWKQVKEMRIDERAWVNATADNPVLAVGQPVSINIQIQNTGKTVARDFRVVTAMELVKNGDDPDFDYSRIGRTLSVTTMADVFPNEKHILKQFRGDVNPAGGLSLPITTPLTQQEYDDLIAGRTYVAIHGRIWYRDIFRIQHWKDYCFWDSRAPSKFTSARCVEHNGEDDN